MKTKNCEIDAKQIKIPSSLFKFLKNPKYLIFTPEENDCFFIKGKSNFGLVKYKMRSILKRALFNTNTKQFIAKVSFHSNEKVVFNLKFMIPTLSNEMQFDYYPDPENQMDFVEHDVSMHHVIVTLQKIKKITEESEKVTKLRKVGKMEKIKIIGINYKDNSKKTKKHYRIKKAKYTKRA